jgi:regulatory protein
MALMDATKPRKPRPPLDDEALRELALTYVGRFATTRAKLRDYLSRKVRERGWSGSREPDPEGIAERLAEIGYIDDAGFALSKARTLSARGYGTRRLLDTLRSAGVGEEDASAAREHSDSEAVAAALKFAQRRRIGPFAPVPELDPRQREKAIAAMVRAGHGFALARKIVLTPAGGDVDPGELAERARPDGS